MKVEKRRHYCKDCRYYNTIYEKCISKFEKQNIGVCRRTNDIVQNNNACEEYKYKTPKIRSITITHIDEVIADIEELEKIFYERDM